jgi:hypothetical protein
VAPRVIYAAPLQPSTQRPYKPFYLFGLGVNVSLWPIHVALVDNLMDGYLPESRRAKPGVQGYAAVFLRGQPVEFVQPEYLQPAAIEHRVLPYAFGQDNFIRHAFPSIAHTH